MSRRLLPAPSRGRHADRPAPRATPAPGARCKAHRPAPRAIPTRAARRSLGAALLAPLAGVLVACGEAPTPASDREAVAPAPAAAPAREAPPAAPAPEPPAAPPPMAVFWQRLETLCGKTYAGYLTIGTEESDRAYGESDLAMDVTDCSDDEIRIAFQVGDDRSRSWILRRQPGALSLRHRHAGATGAEPDDYGGRTTDEGTASRQTFPVDDETVARLPQMASSVWAIEVRPGRHVAYELQRSSDDRYFRVEFELD